MDRCDLGSTREDCLVTGTEQAASSQETVSVSTDTSITSSASSCSDDVLGTLLGIVTVLLIAVICGWMITCFVMSRKLKESKTSNKRCSTCETTYHHLSLSLSITYTVHGLV